jgi:hypothetical protein
MIAPAHKGLTWKDLKALGYRRCCVMFRNGKQCRREQAPNAGGPGNGWCSKHAPVFEAMRKQTEAAIKACNENDE